MKAQKVEEAWSLTELSIDCSGYTRDYPNVSKVLRSILVSIVRRFTAGDAKFSQFICKPADEFHVSLKARGTRRVQLNATGIRRVLIGALERRILPKGEPPFDAKVFLQISSQSP